MAEETRTTEEDFEEGKQVEDYLKDLSDVEEKIKIEPEPHPEAMVRMEDVAKPPVRNKPEKKAEAKKQEPPETPKAAATVPPPVANQPAAITTVATGVNPQPQTPPQQPAQAPQSPAPSTQPTQEAPPAIVTPPQVQPPQPRVVGVDEYIETISATAGRQRYNEVKQNAYRNINALFQGELVLVPAQQLQQMQQQQAPPTPQPEAPKEPTVQTSPEVSLVTELKRLQTALDDPSLPPITKNAIRKRQAELLGGKYEEVPVEAAPVQQSPVNPILANNDKNKKSGKRWSLKSTVLLAVVCACVGVLVVLSIGFLIH